MGNCKARSSAGVSFGYITFYYICKRLLESIKHISKVILFAIDTSFLIIDKDYDNFKHKTNFALACVNNWLQANQLVLLLKK